MVGIGPMGIVVPLIAIIGALGLPLSMPPLPPDPVVLRAAPEECLWYMGWAGNAAPNGASANRCEQILASPEVRQFVAELGTQITRAAQQSAQGQPDAELVAANLPSIANAIFTHPTAIYVSKVGPGPTGMTISGGLVVNFGADAPAVLEKINKIQESILAANPDVVPEAVTLGGVAFKKIAPGPGAPEILWGVKGSLLVAAVGADEAQALVTRLQGSGPVAKWYQELHQKLPVDRPAVTHYINVAGIVQAAAPATADPQTAAVMEALGLAQITNIGGVSGLTSSGGTSKTLVATRGQPQGVLAMIPNKPLTLEDLKVVPREATFSWIMRLDLADLHQQILDLAGKIDPGARLQAEGAIEAGQQQIGLNLLDDILKPLGDSWTVTVLPDAASMPGTAIIGTVTIDDKAKFTKAHEQLLAMFKALLAAEGGDNKPMLTESMVGATKVYSLTLPEAGVFTPTWCITDKHLVVAANPRLVDGFLKRDPASQTLADVKAYQILFGRSAPAIVTYQDTLSLLKQVHPMAQLFGPAAVAQLGQMGIDVTMPTLPNPDKLASFITPNVSLTSRRADGVMLERFYSLPLNVDISTVAPIGVAVLLPAVQAARQAAREMQGTNNLKQLGIALLTYHDVNRKFPAPAIMSKDGKPLLSWRVAILPYLEEQALYEQFHLDEPWDSEHNKALVAQMPAVFASANSPEVAVQGKTRYLLPVGANAMFQAGKQIGLADITDGSSNTIMTVEATPARAVIWTKPDDFVVDPKAPHEGLKGADSHRILVGFADGSVSQLPDSAEDSTLLKALDPRDGK